jgi:hypothetical protein
LPIDEMKDSSAGIPRRRFLGLIGITGVAAVLGAWFFRLPAQGIGQLTALRGRLRPRLHPTPPGPLSRGALEVLEAATGTLVDMSVDLARYSVFFTWRAANLPGYRDLYERFAAVLNDGARSATGRRFVECDVGTRRRLLQNVQLDSRGVHAAVRVVTDRQWLRFEQYIVRQVLELFARTDAWVLLGYEAWPGTPRGLSAYRQPPPGR